MRRPAVVAALIAVVLAVGVSGCGGSDPDHRSGSAGSSEVVAARPVDIDTFARHACAVNSGLGQVVGKFAAVVLSPPSPEAEKAAIVEGLRESIGVVGDGSTYFAGVGDPPGENLRGISAEISNAFRSGAEQLGKLEQQAESLDAAPAALAGFLDEMRSANNYLGMTVINVFARHRNAELVAAVQRNPGCKAALW